MRPNSQGGARPVCNGRLATPVRLESAILAATIRPSPSSSALQWRVRPATPILERNSCDLLYFRVRYRGARRRRTMAYYRVCPKDKDQGDAYWVTARSEEQARRLVALNAEEAREAEDPTK